MALNMKEELSLIEHITTIRSWRKQLKKRKPRFGESNLAGFPIDEILNMFHASGKHFGHPQLLEELTSINHLLSKDMPWDAQFPVEKISTVLRVLLDKHTNTFDHLTYTALPIFELLQSYDQADLNTCIHDQVLLVVAIICDLVRFELNSTLGLEHRFQQDLPSLRKLKQRIYVSLRAVKTFSSFVESLSLPENMDDLIELWRQDSDSEKQLSEQAAQQCMTFVGMMMRQLDNGVQELLQLSIVPVYISHDEYMFIRILQAFEMLFLVTTTGLKICMTHISAQEYQAASDIFNQLNAIFRLSPSLFRILSTMPGCNFNRFREYLKGASAVQSTYYKQMELYASHPETNRLRSPAFAEVPKVVGEYHQPSFVNLQDLTVPVLKSEGNLLNAPIRNMIDSMLALDASFVNWKIIHYRIVKSMIGDARGTGSTSGPPYLMQYLEQPLFPFLKTFVTESPPSREYQKGC